MKWQYQYFISVNGYEYHFGDRVPMPENIEGAKRALTHAVETHEHIPVNILGPLEGDFETPNLFIGRILYADDLPDGSDFDKDTERYVEVTISCSEVRKNTVMGE
jgi:hypothetical protein